MPKINQEEYEVLKRSLSDGYKWIARDANGNCYVFELKPLKKDIFGFWRWVHATEIDRIYNPILFQFVQWEDEEPYNIQELIEEYEYSTEHVSHVVNERVKELGKAWSESEETEVKSKKELIEEWEDYRNGARTVADRRAVEYASRFINDLNQLEEPEPEEQDVETVGDVISDFYKSLERLKEVLGTEVEELEE